MSEQRNFELFDVRYDKSANKNRNHITSRATGTDSSTPGFIRYANSFQVAAPIGIKVIDRWTPMVR
jgi:hypothetical protein